MAIAVHEAPGSTSNAASETGLPCGEQPELLTAREAAGLLRVRLGWVYAHARELGGWRLLGNRGPWRFSRRRLLADAEHYPDKRTTDSTVRRKRRSARRGPSTSLLPIKQRPI